MPQSAVQSTGSKNFFSKPAFLLTIIFLATQLVALFVGYYFIGQQVSVVADSSSLANSAWFFAYVLLSALVLLLVLKYYKGKNFFVVLEGLLVFSTVNIFLSLFSSELIALAAGLIALAIRFLAPKTKQVFLLFATTVVGALLGSSLDYIPALALALLLAGYDYLAVFKTKHMVELAKQLDSRGAAFSILVKRGKDSIELGTGDFVIPAMLSVSFLKVSAYYALASLIGSAIGLGVMLYFLQKKKTYWPALPPVVGGCLILLAIAYFLQLVF